MTEPNFRREPIRSKAVRRAAAGQRCTINLPGICSYDADTVVFAHVHDETFGRGQKADDTSGCFMCAACHAAFDLHRTGLDDLTLLQMLFRAYQRTIRRLVLMDVLHLAPDPKPTAAKRKPTSRKVPAGRKLESSSTWPQNRKIPVRAKP